MVSKSYGLGTILLKCQTIRWRTKGIFSALWNVDSVSKELSVSFNRLIPTYRRTQHYVPELLIVQFQLHCKSKCLQDLRPGHFFMLMFTFSQFSYEFHLHYFSSELKYFNLRYLCSLLITTTVISHLLCQNYGKCPMWHSAHQNLNEGRIINATMGCWLYPSFGILNITLCEWHIWHLTPES